MNRLIENIFNLADDYRVYGDFAEDDLKVFMERGTAPEWVAECFTDQDGGEAPDEFYECLVELFEESV